MSYSSQKRSMKDLRMRKNKHGIIGHMLRQSEIGRKQGFTMVELLVVIAIIGILSGMAQLSWSRVYRAFLGKGAATDLRNALVLARADATSRGRYSGVAIDTANKRFLRFIDSTSPAIHDGKYTSGESLVQGWTSLPGKVVFHSVSSSISSAATTRGCGAPATTGSSTAQSGTFSVVFTPEGNSMATLTLRLSPDSASRDTSTITVLPATGLVTMDR